MTEPHEYDIGRLFDAYTETHAARAGAVSTQAGVGAVAFAALAMLCGCPMGRVGELHQRMLGRELPAGPQQAVEQFQAEVAVMIGDTLP